jgi:acyl carrier protein
VTEPAIEDRIRAYIVDRAALDRPLADDDSLVERGFLPSVRLLDLVGFLEDQFGISLRPVDLVPEKLATVAQLAATVRARLTARRR